MLFETVATSMAEGSPKFKMDVSLVFGGRKEREKVLRTCFDSIEVWSKKYASVGASPFECEINSKTNFAAIIEGEVWVFGVDSTNYLDIVAAVTVAAKWYKVSPQAFMRNIYTKNLNMEGEHLMETAALIQANKSLYTGVSLAIQEAAKYFGVVGEVDFWIMSNSKNPKIPKPDLHQALREGGAVGSAVAKKNYRYTSGSNDGKERRQIITHLHLAKFNI
ncbi:hypothetical protein GCM10007877_22430 [Marinibactrum halimedae]|uniref:Uncharacterized protein n=2 Tax=Marinibactrum halimedae TaxID=1444977 RepID=A0AA37WPR0_9GAMM|nr:hypothetical protein GCM10007877_22430 [Marinibactrum halimedae]